MLEMGPSGLMSGEGKRNAALGCVTAPFLDSTLSSNRLKTLNRVDPKIAVLRLRSGHVRRFQRSECRFVNPRLNSG